MGKRALVSTWVGMAQVGGTFSRDSDTSHETESKCQSPGRNFMKGKQQVGMNLAQSWLLSSAAFALQARGLIKELAAFRSLDIFHELSAQNRKSSLKAHVGAVARMYVEVLSPDYMCVHVCVRSTCVSACLSVSGEDSWSTNAIQDVKEQSHIFQAFLVLASVAPSCPGSRCFFFNGIVSTVDQSAAAYPVGTESGSVFKSFSKRKWLCLGIEDLLFCIPQLF